VSSAGMAPPFSLYRHVRNCVGIIHKSIAGMKNKTGFALISRKDADKRVEAFLSAAKNAIKDIHDLQKPDRNPHARAHRLYGAVGRAGARRHDGHPYPSG